MFKKIDDKLLIVNSAMAGYMVKHGGTIVALAPNKFNPMQTVFYFADDEKAEEAIRMWVANAQTMTSNILYK